MLGIQTPTTEAMEKGKAAHIRLQNHVTHKETVAGLDLPMDFPTVEYHAQRPASHDYMFHGFVDGINFASKSILEIKTSGSKTWSNQDFDRSMQPAYYSFVTGMRKCYLVTCFFDLSKLKVYFREFTDDDWKKAEAWANEGIAVIEKGDFTQGLDENKKCMGCNYGANCYFV